MKRLVLIISLLTFALAPASVAFAGPVPGGSFVGTGKNDPSIDVAFDINDRAVEGFAITDIPFECKDGSSFTGGITASDARLRQDQTFVIVLKTGAVIARVTAQVKRNDNEATGTVEISGRFDGGSPDGNGVKCRTGLIRWTADRT